MICYNCGGQMGPVERVNYEYLALPGVVLVGVQAQPCLQCGQVEYEIPDVAGLNSMLAETLVRKPGRLAAHEVRFLRKQLGWSAQDFAGRLGVVPETVSRWENGHVTIGETPDKLLRMFIVHSLSLTAYKLDYLDAVANGDAPPLQLEVSGDAGWHVRAA